MFGWSDDRPTTRDLWEKLCEPQWVTTEQRTQTTTSVEIVAPDDAPVSIVLCDKDRKTGAVVSKKIMSIEFARELYGKLATAIAKAERLER